MENLIVNERIKKSRLPARLDLAQSGTGLILGLFMWVHMFLVASIILGKGSFDFVAKTMELAFLSDSGHGYPIAVFFAVLCIFTLFIVHAALGVRKFPISWKQHTILRSHMGMLKHQDTNYWYIQVITGFVMFFLGSVHLYVMLTNPGSIDPYLSADRFVSHGMWPLYLVLLVAVELHGTIGLYRLCMKWGWFGGKNPRQSRAKLQMLKQRVTLFFLALGALAFIVFVIIGIGHRDRVGQRYEGTAYASVAAPAEETSAPAEASHEAEETTEAPHGEAAQEEHAETAEATAETPAHTEEAAPAETHETEAAAETETHEAEPAVEAESHGEEAAVEAEEHAAEETASHEEAVTEEAPAETHDDAAAETHGEEAAAHETEAPADDVQAADEGEHAADAAAHEAHEPATHADATSTHKE